jgi:hypothetical protein
MDTLPPLRLATGSLHGDFLKPMPKDCTVEMLGRVKGIKGNPFREV